MLYQIKENIKSYADKWPFLNEEIITNIFSLTSSNQIVFCDYFLMHFLSNDFRIIQTLNTNKK